MKTYIVKLQQVAVMTGMALSGIVGSGVIAPANALTFNFTTGTGVTTSSAVYQGFTDAGAIWSSLFTNDVTLNFTINYQNLGTQTLGETSAINSIVSYTNFANALISHRNPLSTDDNLAVNSLSKNSTFNMLINHTTDSPNGSGSAAPYLDNDGGFNNSEIALSNANAKVLGLTPFGTEDANISFNSLVAWDFDGNDGISAGTYDFVGVAAHEIGHALGFFSGVDGLDNGQGTLAEDDTYVRPLDLFRYSSLSNNIALNTNGTIDFTADNRDKYFSLDGGLTKIASFSRGVNFGNDPCPPGGSVVCPQQADHWGDNLGIGIMDPTAANGEFLTIREADLRAFDVIGWNRVANTANSSVSVPEPENLIGTLICAAFGAKMVLKRRRKLVESTSQADSEQVD